MSECKQPSGLVEAWRVKLNGEPQLAVAFATSWFRAREVANQFFGDSGVDVENIPDTGFSFYGELIATTARASLYRTSDGTESTPRG